MRSVLAQDFPWRPSRISKVIRHIIEPFLDAVRRLQTAQLTQFSAGEGVVQNIVLHFSDVLKLSGVRGIKQPASSHGGLSGCHRVTGRATLPESRRVQGRI